MAQSFKVFLNNKVFFIVAETINGKDLKIPVSYLYSKSITVFTSVLLTKG